MVNIDRLLVVPPLLLLIVFVTGALVTGRAVLRVSGAVYVGYWAHVRRGLGIGRGRRCNQLIHSGCIGFSICGKPPADTAIQHYTHH